MAKTKTKKLGQARIRQTAGVKNRRGLVVFPDDFELPENWDFGRTRISSTFLKDSQSRWKEQKAECIEKLRSHLSALIEIVWKVNCEIFHHNPWLNPSFEDQMQIDKARICLNEARAHLGAAAEGFGELPRT